MVAESIGPGAPGDTEAPAVRHPGVDGTSGKDRPENPPTGDVFTVEPSGITLIGTRLSRNRILNQLIDFDGTAVHGGPLIDQPVDMRVVDGPMGAVLAQLLAGVSYQARLERQQQARARLHTLWLGEESMKRQVAMVQSGIEEETGLPSPLVAADGSVDAGEEYVRMLYQQYRHGDLEAKKMAITDVEMTEGGVTFLDNVMKTAQDEEILIEVIRRLDIADAFGAKWALLEALNHPNPAVVMEVLESLEVWRDPTIRRYLLPLTFHEDIDVREKALGLVEDLDTYALIGTYEQTHDIDPVDRSRGSPDQRAQRQRELQIDQRALRQQSDHYRNRPNRPRDADTITPDSNG